MITVASTTDSMEEVNAAAGIVEEKPAGEEQQEEEQGSPEASHEEGEAESDGGEGAAEEEEGSQKPPAEKKSGFQKRIDKLTRKNYELEESNRSLEERLKRLEQASSGKKEEGKEGGEEEPGKPKEYKYGDPRPKLEDYDTQEDFVEALTDWKLAQRAGTETKREAENRQQETFAAYNGAIADAKTRHEDWDEVIGNSKLSIPKAVQVAIVGLRENGPEIAYRLASDPELCENLVEALEDGGDAAALIEFGAWLKDTLPEVAKKADKADSDQKPKTKVLKPVSKAAEPITPVRTATARTSVPMDELPFSDYKKARAAQIKAARGR